MPDHVTTQLREAAKTAVTGLTTTGSRVYLGRHYPVDLGDGPFLSVHSTGARVARGDFETLDRFTDLMIVGTVSGGSDFEDTLEAMQAEVETAIAADATLAALCQDIWPETIDVELEDEGETRIGRLAITFTAHIVTARGDPTEIA